MGTFPTFKPKAFNTSTPKPKRNLIQVGALWVRDGKMSGVIKIDAFNVQYNFVLSENRFKTKANQPDYHMLTDAEKYPELLTPEEETEEGS